MPSLFKLSLGNCKLLSIAKLRDKYGDYIKLQKYELTQMSHKSWISCAPVPEIWVPNSVRLNKENRTCFLK